MSWLDFAKSSNEILTDYHEIGSRNHPSTHNNQYNSLEVDMTNDSEDFEFPEVFHRQSNGNFFCKACYLTLQGGPNGTCVLKHHLTGSNHNFFLQVYKNKSEAAILVSEAMKKGTLKKHRGLRFFCRSCSLSLEYNSLSLLAGHLQNVDHQENTRTKTKDSPSADSYIKPLKTSSSEEKKTAIEAIDEDTDELTVMSCGLCQAEFPAGNIDMHAISAKHRANIQKLEEKATNKSEFSIPNVNVMGMEEAIQCRIVKEEDVMSYFCNACNKLLPTDGTMNPLKTHLDSANHITASRFNREVLKNTVKREILNGYYVFKFKANKEIPEYLDEPSIPKDTMTHENSLYQVGESSQDGKHIHDYDQSDANNGIGFTHKVPHKTTSMCITTLSLGNRSQQRRNRKKRGLKYKEGNQQEAMFKNEWTNPRGNIHVINTTNTKNPYKYRPKAPPPPSISDCYEKAPSPPSISNCYSNENYVHPPPQNSYHNSYQQYSTETELNQFLRQDYNQRKTSHCMVENRDAFTNSQTYSNPALKRTEMYGYQNAEHEIEPEHIAERNMESVSATERNIDRISPIESISKVSNTITEQPFSPFNAVLILGCLCDDLGLFGETVKAICKNALDDKDNILQVFKEQEVQMTMKIVADKLRKLAEAATDVPSKGKFKVGLEKVVLLLQHSVDI